MLRGVWGQEEEEEEEEAKSTDIMTAVHDSVHGRQSTQPARSRN